MSYHPETTGTGAVSVSPKRHEEEEEDEYTDEEPEYEEEEEEEEKDDDHEKEDEEEERKTRVREFWVRFAIILFWSLVFHLVSSTILTCITGLIVNFAKCFGAIIGLTIFVLPAAYAIYPESVCSFKFRSLAPTIANGLFKLDYFVKRVARAIGDKLGDKLIGDKLGDKLKLKQA